MNKAEEYVEKEIAEFTVNTFDGQEDSTYKYIHIDKAKGIALEGVRIAREEGMRSKLNELIDKDTESFKLKWSDLEKDVEVRVREEIQSIWDSSKTDDLFSYKMSNWLKRKTEVQKE